MKHRHFIARWRTRAYHWASAVRITLLRRLWGMDIGDQVRISGKARLDKTNPGGIHIGDGTLISFDTAILTHDFVNNRHRDTWVGSHCFIGAKAILMPGVRVGDHCIIGSGSVVTADVASRSIAVGNPARVIRSGIRTARWGILLESFPDQETFDRNPAGLGTGIELLPPSWGVGR